MVRDEPVGREGFLVTAVRKIKSNKREGKKHLAQGCVHPIVPSIIPGEAMSHNSSQCKMLYTSRFTLHDEYGQECTVLRY